MPEVPPDVARLAQERAAARADRDFARADAARDELAAKGWVVLDGPDGYRLEPSEATVPAGPVAASEVASILDASPDADVSLQWVCDGWADDIERAIGAFRAHQGAHAVHYVVADVTGQPPDRWGEDVEVLSLVQQTGWASARNAGLRRSRGRVVVALDGSIEPTDDVLTPLVEALETDRRLGIAGPFGIVTNDLRQFDEAPGAGPCDAVEGYLMAFRREVLVEVGGFDEKFRWYRTADIEWSFRVKDAGYRCEVVPVAVDKHEHRMWFSTPPAERARWSKRNFYRFLDHWRDRWDLVLAGEPEHHDREDHHDHEGPVTLPEGR